MKAFFLVGSILFTVIILIIAFENFNASISGFYVFFTSIDTNPTIILLGVSLLGIFTGAFYYGFLTSFLKSEEEEEPGGSIK